MNDLIVALIKAIVNIVIAVITKKSSGDSN